MKIEIKGNRDSFQLHNRIRYIKISLYGDFSYVNNSPVYLNYDEQELTFQNGHIFFQFAEKIKGASLDRIILVSQEFNFPNSFIETIKTKGEIEIGILKSIFLVYNWIEIALTDAYAVNITDKIYDKFIIDYSGKLEIQKDIYFINHKYKNQTYLPFIQRLMDLNLLISANFETIVGNFDTYFIPLIKPGVSREFFMTEFDKTGDKTYKIWKEILKDRDIKIKQWINHRN